MKDIMRYTEEDPLELPDPDEGVVVEHTVNFWIAKRGARKLLPKDNPLRIAMLKEPDIMPAVEGGPKLCAYFRVFVAMRECGQL